MSSRRILIVDDEADIREVAQVSLELVGQFEVLTAGCGRDAIARAHADHPDAILLAVMMPDMAAPTPPAQLQSAPLPRNTPVVFLPAKPQTAERTRLAELGA